MTSPSHMDQLEVMVIPPTGSCLLVHNPALRIQVTLVYILNAWVLRLHVLFLVYIHVHIPSYVIYLLRP